MSALEFNPGQSRLILASGAGEGQLYIWDLTNVKKPSIYTPGNRTYETQDAFTFLSWNKQVHHILAGCLSGGRTEIWDLRQKKQVIHFEDKTRQPSCKSLAWDPSNVSSHQTSLFTFLLFVLITFQMKKATQLVSASDDDRSPVILLWDLRQYQYPTKVLKGHKNGVCSLSWSEHDTSLLLSSGKDNIVNCWDVRKGEIISEVEISSNLVHDVQWSATNPSLISTASFGKVKVHSLHDPSSSPSYVDTEDVSKSEMGVSLQPSSSLRPDFTKPPKWLKRPCGVCLGFGGRLVHFSTPSNSQQQQKPFTVTLETIVTEKQFLKQSQQLKDALSDKSQAIQFCEEKEKESSSPEEKEIWSYLSALFLQNSDSIFLSKLGYDQQVVSQLAQHFAHENHKQEKKEEKEGDNSPSTTPQTPQNTPSTPSPQTPSNSALQREELEGEEERREEEKREEEKREEEKREEDVSSLFGGEGGGENNLFASFSSQKTSPSKSQHQEKEEKRGEGIEEMIASEEIRIEEKRESLFDEQGEEYQVIVSKAIIGGKFREAVECCISVGKWADALILSQEFDSLSQHNNSKSKKGEETLYNEVKRRYLHQNLSSSFLRITSKLGSGNLNELISVSDPQQWKSLLALLLVYKNYCGEEKFRESVSLLASRLVREDLLLPASLCYLVSSQISEASKIWGSPSFLNFSLQQLVDKITLFQSAIELSSSRAGKPIDAFRAQKLNQYAQVVASQGDMQLALFFLSKVDNPQHLDNQLKNLCLTYNSTSSSPTSSTSSTTHLTSSSNANNFSYGQQTQQRTTSAQSQQFYTPQQQQQFYSPSSIPTPTPTQTTGFLQPNQSYTQTLQQQQNQNQNQSLPIVTATQKSSNKGFTFYDPSPPIVQPKSPSVPQFNSSPINAGPPLNVGGPTNTPPPSSSFSSGPPISKPSPMGGGMGGMGGGTGGMGGGTGGGMSFFNPSSAPLTNTPSSPPFQTGRNSPARDFSEQTPSSPQPQAESPKAVIVSAEATQTIENFEYILNNFELGNKRGDLLKKFGILFEKLKSGKVEGELEGQLLQLSSAIRERDTQSAEQINKNLMKHAESWNSLGSANLALKHLLKLIK